LWAEISKNFKNTLSNGGIANIQAQSYFNSLFSYVLSIGNLSKEISIWSYYNYLKSKDKFGILHKTKVLSANEYDFNVSDIVGRESKKEDIILNWDYLISVDTIQTLAEQDSRILTDAFKICEIGAGWGRVAYYITQVNDRISYSIFDIPSVLYISHEYLSQNVKHTKVFDYKSSKSSLSENSVGNGILFYTPHLLEEVEDGGFDLIINIASLQEMSFNQVENYFKVINKKGKSFYTQQRYSDLDMNYSKYPKYDNWVKILDKDVNFHPLWFEQFYAIK
jgi:hypothetical protein